jgi:hypothetical protein
VPLATYAMQRIGETKAVLGVEVSLPHLICFALVALIGLAATGEAPAQSCESMSGPGRTDCLIGRARVLGVQSDIAAGTARLRVDEERLRAATGASVQPRPRTAKLKHKLRLK